MQVSAFEHVHWCVVLTRMAHPFLCSLPTGCTHSLQEFLTLLRLHAPAAPLPSADCTRSSIALQAVACNGCEGSGEHLAREASVACQSGVGGLSMPAHEQMERAVESILCEIGEDPTRPVRALAPLTCKRCVFNVPCLLLLLWCHACDMLLCMTQKDGVLCRGCRAVQRDT